MLIAIDGACKRNGDPTCVSVGVAWIQTEDGNFEYKATFEHESTSQRGELNGLMCALQYAVEHAADDEDIIIVTDSEYMYNTVHLGWSFKWEYNDWVGASGPVKNADMWKAANLYLQALHGRVFMQWTKGHLISYTAGNVKKALELDPEGIELYTRVVSVANRPADHDRIIKDFYMHRQQHGHIIPPPEVALEWLVANTMADSLASYIVKTFDDVLV